MIKYFRKIRQNLIMGNKKGKYFKYAIGEIILVVIGILIAVSINNWNLNRINSNLESQYYIRLLEDLKEEKAILQATINYSTQVLEHAQKAMLIFENPDKIHDPIESLVALYQASQLQTPTSAKSTYQELIASGQINLIKNDSVKTSLIRYYEYNWTQASSVNLPNNYRANLRSEMPNAIQKEIRANCNDIYVKIRNTYEVALPTECEINIPINIAKPVVEILKEDVELKKDLRVLIGNIEAKLGFINSIKMQLDNLINQFEVVSK
tara:strand:- start:175 stop:972 length:798 start_codon:yes stop_codon:yes gene_type:complete